jgi:hypothetical protein
MPINLRPGRHKWSPRTLVGNPSLSVIIVSTAIAIAFFFAALLTSAALIKGPYPNIVGITILVCAVVVQAITTRLIATSRRHKSPR